MQHIDHTHIFPEIKVAFIFKDCYVDTEYVKMYVKMFFYIIGVANKPTVSSEPVSFSQTMEHFLLLNLSEYSEQIRPSIQRTGLAALCYSILGPAVLSKVLIPERDFIFTLALLKFDNNDELCTRILYTLYKGLTKMKVDCPRYGKHWENIGFQGITFIINFIYIIMILFSTKIHKFWPFSQIGNNLRNCSNSLTTLVLICCTQFQFCFLQIDCIVSIYQFSQLL